MPELARSRADGVIDRSKTRGIPLDPSAAEGRSSDWNLCRGNHLHGGQLWRFAFEKVDDPGRSASAASNMLDDGGGANHQHAAQGLVASPSDATQPDLARRRMVLRRQAYPGRELSPRSE